MSEQKFSSIEIDAIGEIMNISLGASATAISTMLGKRVDITTPDVSVLSFDEFEYADLEPVVGVEITYISGLSGSNIMLLKRQDVRIIVGLLMGTEIPDEAFVLDEMNMSAVCEVMNQMMGASSTALSEFLGEVVNISTPVSFEVEDTDAFKKKCFAGEDKMVVVNFHLAIEELVESRFMSLMSISLAKRLVSAFGLTGEEELEEAAPPQMVAAPEPTPDTTPTSNKVMSQEEIEAMMQQAMSQAEPKKEPEPASSNKVMSQAEIEAMMQQQAAPEPEPASNRMMSQAEIEALMQQQAAPTPTPEPASNRTMSQEEIEAMMQQQMAQPQPQATPVQPQPMPMQQQMYYAPPQQMANAMPPQGYGYAPQPRMIQAQPLDAPHFGAVETLGEEQAENLALIMDVPLEISVEIGRTKKLIKDILELTSGSLVVLDKLAGEQVDVYANGQCIAKGDVVVVDDNFGVRITEIIKRPAFLKEQ